MVELSASVELLTTFAALMQSYYPERLDPGSQPQGDLNNKYHFIIVGGGTAGCVLANRLTEVADWTVLLIEAGGAENIYSDAPILEMVNHNSDRDWNYTTVRMSRACLDRNGSCAYPRGHVLGGGSTINGMIYVRGNRADYDGWAEAGCTGWSFQDVLPYFLKLENCSEPSLTASPYRSTGGPQHVQYPRYVTPLREAYVRAGEEFGFTRADYNALHQSNTIDYAQFTISGPSRASASKEYLLPVKERPNLHIIQRSRVTKVLFDGKRAIGVEYCRDSQRHRVYTKLEVIISAGAIDTPKLLMLSGIGPKQHLHEKNIPVLADLPVGNSLQDHPSIPVLLEVNQHVTISSDVWKTNESVYDYAADKKGPFTTPGLEANAFFNPLNASGLPSVQLLFHSFLFSIDKPQHQNIIRSVICLIFPQSRGKVRLASNDYRDDPLIDPNFLGEDYDLQTALRAFELLMDFMKTPTMSQYNPKIAFDHLPNCKGIQNITELGYCIATQYTETTYHPVATAKMGSPEDPSTVVTPDCRVKGFEGLRVIDASIIPIVPRGNINGPVIMVAEKAADIVKSHYFPKDAKGV